MICSSELVVRASGPVNSVADYRKRIDQGIHPDSYCCGRFHYACGTLV